MADITHEPLFQSQNLSLDYKIGDQTMTAVHACNVTIPSGQTTIIYGASGSGKSSLLNVISGLQKPSGGALYYNSEDVYKKSHNQLAYFRARQLGIVYQTNYWVKSLNVLDNISIPLYFQGMGKLSAHKKAKEALEKVDMAGFGKKYPILLSGGEQQRVAMARAIISDPPVIIADEPTGSLDSKRGDEIINLLQDLQKNYNKTIILVTHNMEYLHIANHLLEVQDGHVIEIEKNMIQKTVKKMLLNAQEKISLLMEGGDKK